MIGLVWWNVRKVRRFAAKNENVRGAFLGACLEAALITQLVSSYFISSLDAEWFFWRFALGVSYQRLFGPGEGGTLSEQVAHATYTDESRENLYPTNASA